MSDFNGRRPDAGHWYEGDERPESKKDQISIPITRPDERNGQKVIAVILSRKIYGAQTHYIGHTARCLTAQTTCIHCQNGKPKRWLGYVAAYDLLRKRSCLVELTPKAAEDLEKMAESYASVRGLRIEVGRTAPRGNAPCTVKSCEPLKLEHNQKLPEEFDVATQLDRIWKTYGTDNRSDMPPLPQLDQ